MNLNIDQTMTGELMQAGSMQVFSIDDSYVKNKTGFMRIELAQCHGETDIKFIEDFYDQKKKNPIATYEKHAQFGREYIFI